MNTQVKQLLKSLCCINGWSYGVFWRVNQLNSMLLTFEDAYVGDQMGAIINSMLQHVHMLGEGIVGQLAFTGRHKWLISDTYYGEWNTRGSANNQNVFQDDSEFHQQFSSGIKTIALISVVPHGVVQFGSRQKISETLDFVSHVRSLFQHVESVDGMLLGNAPTTLNHELSVPSRADTYMFSGSSCSNHTSNIPLLDSSVKKTQSAMVIPHPPPSNTGYQNGNMVPSTNYSLHLKNQFQTAGAEAQVILATQNMQLPQVLSQFTSNSAHILPAKSPMVSTRSTEASAIASFEQQMFSGMGMPELPNVFSVNSHTPLHGHTSSSSCNTSVLPSNVRKTSPVEVKKPIAKNLGQSIDGQASAHFIHSMEGEIHQGSTTFQTNRGESKTPDDRTSSKTIAVDNLSQLVSKSFEQVHAGLVTPMQENLTPTLEHSSTASGLVRDEVFNGIPVNSSSNSVQDCLEDTLNPLNMFFDGNDKSLNLPMHLAADNDLFGSFGMEFEQTKGRESWDDIIFAAGSGSRSSLSAGASDCISELDVGSILGSQKGFFTDFGLEQLLGVFSNANSVTRPSSEDQMSTATVGTEQKTSEYTNQVQLAGISFLGGTRHEPLPECKPENINQKDSGVKSRVSSWIDDSYSISSASASVTNPKRSDEAAKVTKKRARPGESTRPRPKDRQQIQDRVKELREIVPSGAKCSIDALLDRTIKHMLFLQSVARYADKLKQFKEPKILGNENGVILKDNSSEGGATWAFEVGCQTMVCPIKVQELSPPGQMLVEMLCEERGFFLEIADIIRGFGLTILKGVMEAREKKIWARFIVEAGRNNITRMDIFLSLVQLLQQTTTAGMGCNSQPTKGVDEGFPTCTKHQQPLTAYPIELVDQ